jgi:predicted polyphosphate/ATP-dependent NAD kinase
VDAIKDGALVAADAGEKELLDLLGTHADARIILSPLGAQGFILGRGNQQISRRIVRRVGVKGIILVSTPQKLAATPVLFVDTGDPALDAEFGDSVQVISGYRIAQRKRVHVHGQTLVS